MKGQQHDPTERTKLILTSANGISPSKHLIGFHASHMSVKANLQDAYENMKEVGKELFVHAKEAKALRCDYGILEHQITSEFNTNMIDLMKEISRVSCALKKVVNEDLAETVTIKHQVIALTKEKILLQEDVHNVTARVGSVEEVIGCDKNRVPRNELANYEVPGQELIQEPDINDEYV